MKFESKARRRSYLWLPAVVSLVVCAMVVVSPCFRLWREEDIRVKVLGVRSEGAAKLATVMVRNGSQFIATMDGDPPDRRVVVRSQSAWSETTPTFHSKEVYTVLRPGESARVTVPIPSGGEAVRIGLFFRSGSAGNRIASLFMSWGLSMRVSLKIASVGGWLPQGRDAYALRWSEDHPLAAGGVPNTGNPMNSVLPR
jgi:hypothetical protein